MSSPSRPEGTTWLPPLVRSIIALGFSLVVIFKLATTPMQLTIDFPALLTLLLALFSVGLAALFYFKTTETSNAFYDNTFKYTKDIAELLVRIESGFGERLKHLDEGYARIQERFFSAPASDDVGEVQEHLTEEEQDFEKKLQERDQLIEGLLEKAKVEGKDKQRFLAELRRKELQLQSQQSELALLREQVRQLHKPSERSSPKEQRLAAVTEYIRSAVLDKLGGSQLATLSTALVQRRWQRSIDLFPKMFLRDLESLGLTDVDGVLTPEGVRLIRSLVATE